MTKKSHSGDKNSHIYQIEQIPLTLIDVEGQSVRGYLDDDHVVELAMSISRHGLLEPIVVRAKGDGRYQLEAGFHRLCAFTRLNQATIPCHVRHHVDAPIKAVALVENICRKNLSLQEEIEAVDYLHNTEGLSPSQICDLTGKSRTWVDRRIAAKNLPPDLRAELFSGSISIGHAEELSRIEDMGVRKYATNSVIQAKLTVRETADLVALYMATPSLEEAIEAGIKRAKELQEAPQAIPCDGECGTNLATVPFRVLRLCLSCIQDLHEAITLVRKEAATHGDTSDSVHD